MLKADMLKYYQKKTGLKAGDRAIILAAAQELETWPQAIDHWKEIVPKGRAYELYVKTNGKIPLRVKDYK